MWGVVGGVVGERGRGAGRWKVLVEGRGRNGKHGCHLRLPPLLLELFPRFLGLLLVPPQLGIAAGALLQIMCVHVNTRHV